MSDLKPCPNQDCEVAELDVVWNGTAYVTCDNCGLCGPESDTGSPEETEPEAIHLWNALPRQDQEAVLAERDQRIAALEAEVERLRGEMLDVGGALQGARDTGGSVSYYVLGAWGDRLVKAAEAGEGE